MAWISCVIGLLAAFVATSLWKRPQVALGVIIPLAWILPVWVATQTEIEAINVRTGVGVGALILYCLMPGATFPWRFVPCDLAVIGLTLVHLASDFFNAGFDWSVPVFAYVEWILPYLCGRLAFQRREDLDWIGRGLCVTGLALAIFAWFEAWLHVNPFEWIFGLRPEDRFGRDKVRWGMRRAYGPTMHPIYLGVILCWYTGVWIYSGWRSLTSRASAGWLLAALVGMSAPIATGSRGPVLGVGFASLGFIICYFKQFRYVAGVAIVALGFLVFYFQDSTLSKLDDWSGDLHPGHGMEKVVFDNEELALSSARSRILVFEIYWKALANAGLLGYGTDAVATFPVNVPLGPDEAKAVERIWMVDNQYVLLTLRFGYAGLAIFVAIGGLAIWQLLRVHDRTRGTSIACWSAALCGATASLLMLLWIVWMPGELGFLLFWSYGASSGLWKMCQEERSQRRHVRPLRADQSR